MIYEIINPSDAYTLEADKFPTAAIVTLFLGEGKYGLHDEAGQSTDLPLFILGGDPEVWFKNLTNLTISEYLDTYRGEVAACFESVLIGKPRDRVLYNSAVSKMSKTNAEQFAAEWHDKRRSSMNDIGKTAKEYALFLRKKQGAAT